MTGQSNFCLSPSKTPKWIRAVIGGGLSLFVVGIVLFLLSLSRSPSSGIILYLNVLLALPGIFLHTWLFGDPFARLLPPAEASTISQRIILLTLLVWFLLGFGSTYFIRNNGKAIVAWLSVVMILAILVIILS